MSGGWGRIGPDRVRDRRRPPATCPYLTDMDGVLTHEGTPIPGADA
ncbi:hypothetical protein [Streptomyces sp. NBC_01320]|nr:hypothetical protein OG395_32995 [Streptomyces sp. NBC_01320]